jgi:hypothetical protein
LFLNLSLIIILFSSSTSCSINFESIGIHFSSKSALIANSTCFEPTTKFLVQKFSGKSIDFKICSSCFSAKLPLPLFPDIPKKVFSILSRGVNFLSISKSSFL